MFFVVMKSCSKMKQNQLSEGGGKQRVVLREVNACLTEEYSHTSSDTFYPKKKKKNTE